MTVITNSIDNTIGASNSGVTNTLTIQNPSNTASSQAQDLITVGGTTAGDPWSQYTVGATRSFAVGIDNSDSQNFKITSAAGATVTPSTALTDFLILNTGKRFMGLLTSSADFGATTITNSDVKVIRTNIAGNVGFNLTNLDNTDTTSDSGHTIVVGGTSAGDPFTTYSITGASNYTFGIDNSNSDIFKLTDATRPSTGNSLMTVTTAGEVNFPLTPCFAAFLPTTDSNATGNGTVFTIGSGNAWSEIFDQGADFNTNGTFTAPVSGRYLFAVEVGLDNIGVAHTAGLLQLVTSNRTWRPTNSFNPANMRASDNQLGINGSMIADMDASDTATLQIAISNSTLTVGISGNNGGFALTYFTGKLEA